MNVDIGACLSNGFERVKNNPLFYIVGFLIFVFGGAISFQILSGPLMVGYMRGMMKEDRGQRAEIGDVFSGFNDFVPALIAHLVGGLIVAVGFFLCVIPGLLILPLVWLSLYAVAAGDKDGINAIKTSWNIVMNNMVTLALAAFVFGLVGMLGALACGIGQFFTIPVAFAAIYRMCQIAHASAAPAPTFAPPGGMPPGPGGMPPMGPPR